MKSMSLQMARIGGRTKELQIRWKTRYVAMLTVLVQYKNVHTLWERTLEAVEIILHSIALPETVIQRELDEMQSVTFSRTTNRQVLGSMIDFVFAARAYIKSNPSATLTDISFQLNQSLCSPLKRSNPQEAALNLLTAPRQVSSSGGRSDLLGGNPSTGK